MKKRLDSELNLHRASLVLIKFLHNAISRYNLFMSLKKERKMFNFFKHKANSVLIISYTTMSLSKLFSSGWTLDIRQ